MCIKNIKSERIFNTNEIVVIESSGYIDDSPKILFLTVSDTIFWGTNLFEKTRKFFAYDIKSKSLEEILVPNGHNANSLKVPSYLSVIDDTLFYLDSGANRISAMKYIDDKLKNQYTFDLNSRLKGGVFNIIDSKMYASKSMEGFELNKTLSVYNIIQDRQYKDSKILSDGKHFMEYTKYRDQLDYRINKILKIRAEIDSSSMMIDMTETLVSENTYFAVNTFKYVDKIFALNGCGTDIYEINGDSEKLCTTIDTMLSLRKQEVSILKEHKLTPGQFNTYAKIRKVFCDESNNMIMIYLKRMKRVKEASGDMNDYLVIKLTESNKAEDEIVLPIDFMPIHYNKETSTFYGLKKEEGVLKYVEYKLEV